MFPSSRLVALILVAFCSSSLAQSAQAPVAAPARQSFPLKDRFVGNDFFGPSWKWEIFDDPTHGRVNYVDQATARAKQLAYISGGKFIMRSDAETIVPPTARGRDSIRITSNTVYDDAVVILDVAHVPFGCGTWPAFWSLSAKGPWPLGGEIDIIEGVNLASQNLMSLHTTPNCIMDPSRLQTGQTVTNNCDAAAGENQGCGTAFMKPGSYGTEFNAKGGGYYVMKKSATEGISGWFWPRGDPTAPEQVVDLSSATPVDTSQWGTPDAFFPHSQTCDHRSHFDAHSLVFDLTFCGDWGGSVFPTSGCAAEGVTCQQYVDSQPQQFRDAYWEINSLRVFAP